MSKKLALIYVIVVVLIYNAYNYVNNRVINPFMIDAATYVTENGDTNLLHTKQDYNFRLVNTSDKAVMLISIELQGYQGIKPGTLTVSGKPLTKQRVMSNRVYSSPNSWSTNSQGLSVEYQVEIVEPKIQNPKSVWITYSYFGIKHTQIVNFPSAQSVPFSNNTIGTSFINFKVSFFSVIFMALLLLFIYKRRETNEGNLGWKLFGYYYLGAFNLNFNLLIPLGIFTCLILLQPSINAKVKMFAALSGFTVMMLYYVVHMNT